MDILSKDTLDILNDPAVREAIQLLLDKGINIQTVTLSDGRIIVLRKL